MGEPAADRGDPTTRAEEAESRFLNPAALGSIFRYEPPPVAVAAAVMPPSQIPLPPQPLPLPFSIFAAFDRFAEPPPPRVAPLTLLPVPPAPPPSLMPAAEPTMFVWPDENSVVAKEPPPKELAPKDVAPKETPQPFRPVLVPPLKIVNFPPPPPPPPEPEVVPKAPPQAAPAQEIPEPAIAPAIPEPLAEALTPDIASLEKSAAPPPESAPPVTAPQPAPASSFEIKRHPARQYDFADRPQITLPAHQSPRREFGTSVPLSEEPPSLHAVRSPWSRSETAAKPARPKFWTKAKLMAIIWIGAVIALAATIAAVWPYVNKLIPRVAAVTSASGVIEYPSITVTAPVAGQVDQVIASPGSVIAADQDILTLHTGWRDSIAAATASGEQTQLDALDSQISDLSAQRATLAQKGNDEFYRIELDDVAERLARAQDERDALAAQMATPSSYAPTSTTASIQAVTAGRAARLIRYLVTPGETLVKGAAIAEVGDCTQMFAEAPTSALNAAGLYAGDLVTVLLAGDPTPVQGTIERAVPGGSEVLDASGQALSHIDLIVGDLKGVWGSCPTGAAVTISPEAVAQKS